MNKNLNLHRDKKHSIEIDGNAFFINEDYEEHPVIMGTVDWCIQFVNRIEGWKTRCKNLHWAAPKMNIHKELDKCYDLLADYQDSFVEGFMGILGRIRPDVVDAMPCNAVNAMEFIDDVIKEVCIFNKEIPNEPIWSGIKSENDSLIQNLTQTKTLFEYCDC